MIILSIGSWIGRVGPRPADGETAHLASPKERLETVRQVLSEVPLIDGHNDLPWNIRNFVHNQLADFDFEKDLRQVAPWSKSAWSQTDLVRLRQGMVGGQVIISRRDKNIRVNGVSRVLVIEVNEVERTWGNFTRGEL